MNATPRLSIGLPVYNGEKFLAESLDALLGQTYQDFELIISDNASTDSTASICERYIEQDPRIRYFRQPRNLGAAPNHNVVVEKARGELFKWASSDDLYARDLLERCIGALDEDPRIVLANSWMATIDDSSRVTEAVEYPMATDAQRASDRFRSTLGGAHGADDYGGVIRTEVLRKTPLQASYHFADRTIIAELTLHGPFYHVPDWLYFRRVHADAASKAHATVRSRCANWDPRRGNLLLNPPVRLYAEFVWGYIAAIRRAPLSSVERQECYRHLARWVASRAIPAVGRVVRGGVLPSDEPVSTPLPAISVDAVVAGRESRVP